MLDEAALRALIEAVREGRLPRRHFVRRLAAAGLSVPVAGALLLHAGIAPAQEGFTYRPTRRGGGGVLRILSWQGPTILNGHFSSGSKDLTAARLFYEPMAAWDIDGGLHPVLAAEIPSLDNGGIARDGLSATWRIKPGVSWHDGRPLTADDLIFTWEFVRDPAAAAFTLGTYQPITSMRKLDSHTVRVSYDKPMPYWADAFVNPVLPRHAFAGYMGAKSREAPASLKPVGTGPYRLLEFRPGDFVRGEANPAYHMPNRPHFDFVEIKGGGDAVSAARTVLQTGEFDAAWQLQVEDDVLQRLEAGGRGRVHTATGGDVEYIMLNHADPWSEVDGERSSPKSRHPFLLDPAVRQALAMLVDRDAIQRHIYGRAAVATPNFLNNPERFHSRNQKSVFDIARANALLDGARWVRGSGGIRSRDGRRLKLLFHTSTNPARQKTQAVVKQAMQAAGIEMELKSTVASVYFSPDLANPDTNGKFLADLQMHTITRGGPDPGRFMELFCSWLVASRDNKWLGRNITRWRNDEYDRVFRAAETEMDPVKRAAMLIRLNDIVCDDRAVIPLLVRAKVTALSRDLRAPISGWGIETGRIHDWYRGPA